MRRPDYIVWTGRMDSLGTVWPSISLGVANSIDEAANRARAAMEYAKSVGRKLGPCVITTYGAQKIVAGVPALRA